MKTIKELASTHTTSHTVRADSFTAYELEPVRWLKEIVDAAKKRLFFTNAVRVFDAPKGTKDVVIPKKKYMLPSWNSTAAESAAVNYTDMSNLDGVVFTPARASYGIALSNYAVQVNAVNLISSAKDELTYHAGDVVDQAVATGLGDATRTAATTSGGAQSVYGGDARGYIELAAGDTLTTDMIAEAKRKLQSTKVRYWAAAGASAAAEAENASGTYVKNPWYSTPDEPFLLFIAPEQENILLTDSQFINAAEYGGNEVVLNGEVGKYLGTKILVTSNVEHTATATAFGSTPDGIGTTGSTATAADRCMMVKAKRCGGLAYGIRPRLYAFSYPSNLEQRVILEQTYQSKAIQDDAVVFLDVSST